MYYYISIVGEQGTYKTNVAKEGEKAMEDRREKEFILLLDCYGVQNRNR